MADQYRATPEQWFASRYDWGRASSEALDGDPAFRCLLELRDRIAALEAGASAPADHVADASKMVATDEELYELWERGALYSLNLRLRAIYNLGRQHGAA
jgi:hypothetical protein